MAVNNGNTVTVSNITFRNGNAATHGGGIYCHSSTLTIRNCAFTDNVAGDDGGAIFSVCVLTIEDSTFTNNTANYGGAIFIDSGSVDITRSVISNNKTTGGSGDGGGLYVRGTLTISDTTIDNNSSTGTGGGVYALQDMTMRRCTVSNNQSDLAGGGLQIENNAVVIVNSTISGNETDGDGGGLYLYLGNTHLYNTTVVGNTADADMGGGNFGGGIYLDNNAAITFSIANSIVAGNMLGAADDDCYKGAASSFTSGGYNIFDATSATCDPLLLTTDMTGVDVATIIDPLLADNGGPTLTHALIASSPAIDAGTPEADGGCRDHTATALTVDQRSMTRPVNGRCDVGAVELGTCGDSAVDAGEECDDGNADDTDACLSTCIAASCGDGNVQAGVEECDDGNTTDGDGCAANCTTESADDTAATDDSTAASSSGGCSTVPQTAASAYALAPLVALLGIGLIRRRKRA